jgi:hypothetical protein
VTGLEYNGKEQALVTEGGAYGQGQEMQYSLTGAAGSFVTTIPVGKDAGEYTVYYKLSGDAAARGSVAVTIAKKAVTVSGGDVTSVVGAAEPAALTYSVSGVPHGEEIAAGDVTVSTDADLSAAGTYDVNVSVTAANYPNYTITTNKGTYSVTATEFNVTAEDVHGVYGTTDAQGTAYAGYNIKVTKPEGTEVYYSYDPNHPNTPIRLTNDPADDNTGERAGRGYYKTYGALTLVNLPAGVGTHTVSYFVVTTDGNTFVSGTKKVVIEKAQQTAPTGITTTPESAKGRVDGYIKGLTPRKMEYRLEGGDGTYQTVEISETKVTSGTWLVRWKGDENHFPSPDTKAVVGVGEGLTVTFDSNGGTEIQPVTGIVFGDVVSRPEDPVREGLEFFGWYKQGEPYNFDLPVTRNLSLIAYWKGDGIPTPNTLYYTGEAQALVTAPEGERLPDGYKEIRYALGSSADAAPASGWSLSIPTGTETKVYYVWYKLIGEQGTPDTDPACIQVRIQAVTTLVPYKAPTASTPGNKAYYIGNDGKLYWDALGLAEILDASEVIIPVIVPTDEETSGNGTSYDGSKSGGKSGSTGKHGMIAGGGSGGSGIIAGGTGPAGTSGSGNAAAVYDGRWSQDAASGWHFSFAGGNEARSEWVLINYGGKNSWFAFDENGTMRTGWFVSGGSTYYLQPESNGSQGEMVTGWQRISGKWYYFEVTPGGTFGRMYRGETTPDGFTVGEDGSWDGSPAVAANAQ